MIALGIEAPKRKTKTILPARGAVAAVALAFHEDRHDIETEGDRLVRLRLLHGHRHLADLALILDLQRRRAIRQRRDHALLDLGLCRLSDREFRLPGHVAMHTVRFRHADDERLAVANELQVHIRGENFERICRINSAPADAVKAVASAREDRNERWLDIEMMEGETFSQNQQPLGPDVYWFFPEPPAAARRKALRPQLDRFFPRRAT